MAELKTENRKPETGATIDREILARRIALRLFTNGAGQRARWLVLLDDGPDYVGDKPRNLGGWCLKAVVDQIEDILKADS